MEKPTKAVIIPGNGSGDVYHSNWYGWLHEKLNGLDNFTCSLNNMPDPVQAKEEIWIPFMRDELNVDEKTIIIGHSSGACAAVRYAERYKVHGIVLISAYTSDLGDSLEKASGYFNRQWEWEKVKSNTSWICQFASRDDPFLPWKEQKEVADSLNADLKEYSDKGHFMSSSFPELLKVVMRYLSS